MSKTDAVDHLINIIEGTSKGCTLQMVAMEALGEAGGNQAIDYLIKYAGAATRSSSAHYAALKALGRASRNAE